MDPSYFDLALGLTTFIIENSFIASFTIFDVIVAASNVIGLVFGLCVLVFPFQVALLISELFGSRRLSFQVCVYGWKDGRKCCCCSFFLQVIYSLRLTLEFSFALDFKAF